MSNEAPAAQLTFLVGGDGEAVVLATPLMEAMGWANHHIGPTGSGTVMKLAVNALLSIRPPAFAELLGFLTRSGLDPARATGIRTGMPVISQVAAGLAKLMVGRNFAPIFPIALVEKDLDHSLFTADRAGAEMPTTRAVRDVFCPGTGPWARRRQYLRPRPDVRVTDRQGASPRRGANVPQGYVGHAPSLRDRQSHLARVWPNLNCI